MGAVHKGTSRSETFAGYSTLEVEVCRCGVLFAAPQELLRTARETGRSFYCPNGHSLVYGSENARLMKELERAKDRAAAERAYRDQAEASLRAQKGVSTKLRKKVARVEAGVCPHCNRTFQNVARHMKNKHPEHVHQ